MIEYIKNVAKPPYSVKDTIQIFFTVLLIILIPLTVVAVFKAKEVTKNKVRAALPIEIGVVAEPPSIPDPAEPKQLTYVYHYVNWDSKSGGPTFAAAYIKQAYNYNFKPILVFYTSYDVPANIDFNAWDQIMNVIRTDGRDVWVVVEPDMVGSLRNSNACSTTLKQYEDRFLQTKAPTAHLGYHMSPWLIPYDGGPQGDATGQKDCWLASGGNRMEDIYVDILDKDQELYGQYPWSVAQLTEKENWFMALEQATGRKIGVWQIPIGNSTCNNGARSNFVETWLTDAKLNALSPYVNRLLFGGGNPGTSGNLPREGAYDCGFFNQRVSELFSGSDTQSPTANITSPSSGQAVSGTITVTVNASDNVGVTKVEFYVDSVLKSTDTTSPYSFSWDSTTVANGSHTFSAKAYDAAGNVGTSSPISVTVDNPSSKLGDLNGDNKVDIYDLSILLPRWGTSDATADLNKNGSVDIFDLSTLLSHWGT